MQEVHKLDVALLTKIQRLPKSLRPAMIAGTMVGQPIVLFGLMLAFIGYTYYLKEFALAKVGACAAALLLVSAALKLLFQRARPDQLLFASYKQPSSYSFPSGHAYGSMLVFGLFAYLAATRLSSPLNVIVPGILALLILVIGVSRIYLGAHYPSDVIAGWLLGALILTILIKLSRI